jgi:KDO2-lipid IV(A) lauroyltransferase
LIYWGYMLARLVVRVMPLSASYWIADRIGDLWYVLSPRTRADLTYNIGLVPGAPAGKQARAALMRRVLRNFARVVTEFLYFPRLGRKNLGDLVDTASFEPLLEILRDKPVILVTCHLGNWELAAATVAMLGADLHVVAYDHPDARVARLFRERRQAKGLGVISVTQTPREIAGLLRTASVGIVGDRDYAGGGRDALFLGVKVKVPYAYAGLAVAFGRPVVAGLCLRHPDGKYRLTFAETVYDPGRHTSSPEQIVERCLAIFEKGVEKYLEQWYFFQRVDTCWASTRECS